MGGQGRNIEGVCSLDILFTIATSRPGLLLLLEFFLSVSNAALKPCSLALKLCRVVNCRFDVIFESHAWQMGRWLTSMLAHHIFAVKSL